MQLPLYTYTIAPILLRIVSHFLTDDVLNAVVERITAKIAPHVLLSVVSTGSNVLIIH